MFRFVFFTAGALAGIAASTFVDLSAALGTSSEFVIIVFIVLGGAIGYLVGGILGREAVLVYAAGEQRLRELGLPDIALLATGLFAGLVAAFLLSYPLRLVVSSGTVSVLMHALLYVMCMWAGVRVAMIKRLDLPSTFPGLSAKHLVAPPKLLDTSAIIDGRFPELARIGFLEGVLRVPRFVLVELQTLADSEDEIRRARGRRGLDLLARLHGGDVVVEVFEADYAALPEVDEKLLALAKDTSGAIVTVDANLARVARVRRISALNVNELAAALKPAFLPGESLRVAVVREGRESDQGVGYLADGTMVVIQGGREHVGSDVDSEVTSVLQTAAGRMIFTRVKAG